MIRELEMEQVYLIPEKEQNKQQKSDELEDLDENLRIL